MFQVCAQPFSCNLISREKVIVLTLRHCSPQWSLIGPSMPKATPFHHQKHPTMAVTHTPKAIHFVLSDRRRDVNTKWSIMCASISTAK